MSLDLYLKNLYQGALSARKTINQANLEAEGWKAGSYNKEEAMGPQAYYYLYDLPSGWTWMCSIPLNSAKQLSSTIQNNKATWEDVRNDLGLLVYQKTNNKKETLDPEWEDKLARLISAYSGTTQILNLSGGTEEHQHFIVLNYRESSESPDSLLRPFIFPNPSKGVIEFETFKDVIQQVISRDRESKPEWFKPLN